MASFGVFKANGKLVELPALYGNVCNAGNVTITAHSVGDIIVCTGENPPTVVSGANSLYTGGMFSVIEATDTSVVVNFTLTYKCASYLIIRNKKYKNSTFSDSSVSTLAVLSNLAIGSLIITNSTYSGTTICPNNRELTGIVNFYSFTIYSSNNSRSYSYLVYDSNNKLDLTGSNASYTSYLVIQPN